ncbi:phosphatase-2c protein [Thalictrum thalictroides]|uniref:Phosphatase-2c protein n=1 Tax=Thalictrum thalictroides TaxID=46969 RepID=A0A7J6VBP1_THATH|nr:phosphatase-2c protein [Thalictrum thalictroides]
MVSKRVRDSLPLKLCSQWEVNSKSDQKNSMVGSMDSEETASVNMDDEWCHSESDENQNLPEMYLPLKQSLLKAFKLMDKDLKLHPIIDCFCSGTTAVTLVKQGRDLVIANVGDSRAVLGMRDKYDSLIAVQLTVDLKPNLPRESARIEQCKGRVFALQDEPEVSRVWLPNNDSPGLAMARAFGDFCLKDFGLISVPDISYRCLTEKDEFIVLATDGVWDVLSNKEVVDIVASAPSRTMAARAVVESAVRSWRLKFPTSKSDDCAAICLYLDQNEVQGEIAEMLDPKISATEDVETTTENSQSADMDGGNVHSPTLQHLNTLRVETTTENSQSADMDGGSVCSPTLQHLNTLRSTDEIVPVSESTNGKLPMRSQSMRSLAECISTAEDEEWSALEGYTRVNSLLKVPRFLPGDRRASNRKKWF